MVSSVRASQMLGVTMFVLRKWRNLDVGPRWIHVTSRQVVYPVEELIQVLEEGGVRGIAAAIRAKRDSLLSSPTPVSEFAPVNSRATAAVGCLAAVEAWRRRREARAAQGSLTRKDGK
jgi:hypothetical protein